jgi:hypothetical protein
MLYVLRELIISEIYIITLYQLYQLRYKNCPTKNMPIQSSSGQFSVYLNTKGTKITQNIFHFD